MQEAEESMCARAEQQVGHCILQKTSCFFGLLLFVKFARRLQLVGVRVILFRRNDPVAKGQIGLSVWQLNESNELLLHGSIHGRRRIRSLGVIVGRRNRPRLPDWIGGTPHHEDGGNADYDANPAVFHDVDQAA